MGAQVELFPDVADGQGEPRRKLGVQLERADLVETQGRLVAVERRFRADDTPAPPIACKRERHADSAPQLRKRADDTARRGVVETAHGGSRDDQRERESDPETPRDDPGTEA